MSETTQPTLDFSKLTGQMTSSLITLAKKQPNAVVALDALRSSFISTAQGCGYLVQCSPDNLATARSKCSPQPCVALVEFVAELTQAVVHGNPVTNSEVVSLAETAGILLLDYVLVKTSLSDRERKNLASLACGFTSAAEKANERAYAAMFAELARARQYAQPCDAEIRAEACALFGGERPQEPEPQVSVEAQHEGCDLMIGRIDALLPLSDGELAKERAELRELSKTLVQLIDDFDSSEELRPRVKGSWSDQKPRRFGGSKHRNRVHGPQTLDAFYPSRRPDVLAREAELMDAIEPLEPLSEPLRDGKSDGQSISTGANGKKPAPQQFRLPATMRTGTNLPAGGSIRPNPVRDLPVIPVVHPTPVFRLEPSRHLGAPVRVHVGRVR